MIWRKTTFSLIFLAVVGMSAAFVCPEDWGFFGHRRINRLAVFTLPMEMMPFFRENIDFITDHAVDPDKRRYATRHEGVRHYIDLDHWGQYPFPQLPRKWSEALACHSDLKAVTSLKDTIGLYTAGSHSYGRDSIVLNWFGQSLVLPFSKYLSWFQKHVLPQYYEDEWPVSAEALAELAGDAYPVPSGIQGIVFDRFSEHGILPYHLLSTQRRLTEAFRKKDVKAILRHCTDFGHYIGDAHVPLHTTKNYNGQFTNQDGIHAFWESRIPELLADEQFDFFVGKAVYIQDPESYFWEMVLESHTMVDSVLSVERRLRETFPVDRQMCFDNRMGQVVRTQCREFAKAYNEALRGQIERRFRSSIQAIASAWYTAWVDAGQPDLRQTVSAEWTESERAEMEAKERRSREGNIMGRPHDN